MIQNPFRQILPLATVLFAFVASPPEALGQLLTQHIKGGVGLKVGSQPPPGGYIAGRSR